MRRVEASGWHGAVAHAIDDGFQHFVTLMGIDDGGPQVWVRLRNDAGVDTAIGVDAASGVATIIDLLPAAAWYEREAAEMYGIVFLGHDTRPLLLDDGGHAPMLRSHWLAARTETPWPGEKEPGGVAARRRQLPPGVRP